MLAINPKNRISAIDALNSKWMESLPKVEIFNSDYLKNLEKFTVKFIFFK